MPSAVGTRKATLTSHAGARHGCGRRTRLLEQEFEAELFVAAAEEALEQRVDERSDRLPERRAEDRAEDDADQAADRRAGQEEEEPPSPGCAVSLHAPPFRGSAGVGRRATE